MRQDIFRGYCLIGLLVAGFSTTGALADPPASDRLIRVTDVAQDNGEKSLDPCCDLAPGDRVQWQDAAPPTLGTVVCCDAEFEAPLFVTWDDLTGWDGPDSCFYCDEPTTCDFPDGSAFWTTCESVILVADGCAADYVVTAPGIWQGDTCGAGNDCDGRGSPERVYQVTLPESGTWTFSLCGSASAYDSYTMVGTTPGAQDLGYGDDSGECGPHAFFNLTLGAGTYYVTIEGYAGACGDYVLSIDCSGCETPVCGDGNCDPNETCDNCPDDCGVCNNCLPDYSVTGTGQWQGNTCGAGNDCDGRESEEHVYEVSILIAGNYTFSLCDSNPVYDSFLLIGTTPGGDQIGFSDDTVCIPHSELTVNLSPGTYYVTIEGFWFDECGDYVLDIKSDVVCHPPSDPQPVEGEQEVPLDVTLSWNGATVPGTLPRPEVIYGNDDRLDEYQVADAALKAVGDSTVALLSTGSLMNNGDGTYSLASQTFAEYIQWAMDKPLCSDEPFRDQPVSPFCSGFLVADDVIATAGHCIRTSYDCSTTAFVFGFVMNDATSPALTIPADDIYYCSEIIDRNETTADWALLRLDRPVVGHTPVSVRNGGQVSAGDDLMMIGHPVGLPRKYAAGATVRGNTHPDYFEANTDSYMGNSGSAVFNLDTLQVEGILFDGQEDFNTDGVCVESNVCPDNPGCPGYERCTRTKVFANLIPSYEISFGVCGETPTVTTNNAPYFDPPGDLQPCTDYCWSVTNACGATTSPTWTFRTGDCAQLELLEAGSQRGDDLCAQCSLPIPLDGHLVDPRACMSGRFMLSYQGVPSDPGCDGLDIVNATCLDTFVAENHLIIDLELSPNACVQVTDAYGHTVKVLTHIGNVNGDDDVNVIDLQNVKNHVFEDFDCSLARYDVNCDCQINVIDLQQTKNNVFEPASCSD